MKNGRSTGVNATAGRDAGFVAQYTPDLFEEPPTILGIWPGTDTLEGRFLARLLHGAEMTHRDWLNDAKSMRLAAEVKQLRDLGWLVRTRLETVTTADCGRPARIAHYWLESRQRESAVNSEQGRLFIEAVAAFEARRVA